MVRSAVVVSGLVGSGWVVGSGRDGSGLVLSGTGDRPRQRNTVGMHRYVLEVPHMTDYSILHAANRCRDILQVIYKKKKFPPAVRSKIWSKLIFASCV